MDPKDQHHFAGSGYKFFSTDPYIDPDQNLAHFKKKKKLAL